MKLVKYKKLFAVKKKKFICDKSTTESFLVGHHYGQVNGSKNIHTAKLDLHTLHYNLHTLYIHIYITTRTTSKIKHCSR